MASYFQIAGSTLSWSADHELLTVQPWGPDGVRVRATKLADFADVPGALLDESEAGDAGSWQTSDESAVLVNGKLRVEISSQAAISMFHSSTDQVLLKEPERVFWSYP